MNIAESSLFNIFRQEFSNENKAVRINSVNRLPIIAFAYLEKGKTNKELEKIILEISDINQEDEILLGLAQSLRHLIPFLSSDFIVKILCSLMSGEEVAVREKAIETFEILIETLDNDKLEELVIPKLKESFSSKNFIEKLSTIYLIKKLFIHTTESNKEFFVTEMIDLFNKEESLMMKRTIIGEIGKIVKYIAKESVQNKVYQLFKTSASNESDSIKQSIIESIVELAKITNSDENKTHMIPLIIQLTGDRSWRVKNHLAGYFDKLIEALGEEVAENSMITIFSTLLRDSENEVRISSVKSLKRFVGNLGSDKISVVFGFLKNLCKDTIAIVRIEVACIMVEIMKRPTGEVPDNFFKEEAKEIIMILFNDKDVEVLIETIRIFPFWFVHVKDYLIDMIINKTINFDLNSNNWRLRIEIVDCLGKIAEIEKDQKFFDRNIKNMFLKYLTDVAYGVRETTYEFLERQIFYLEEEYFVSKILPSIKEITLSKSLFYNIRISAVKGLVKLVNNFSHNLDILREAVGILIILAEDSIPNIRYISVKLMKEMIEWESMAKDRNQLVYKINEMKEKEVDKELRIILN